MDIGMYKIQIIGNKENKVHGFYSIITSGESANCLEDDIFFVNDRVVMKLKQDKIKFKVITAPLKNIQKRAERRYKK